MKKNNKSFINLIKEMDKQGIILQGLLVVYKVKMQEVIFSGGTSFIQPYVGQDEVFGIKLRLLELARVERKKIDLENEQNAQGNSETIESIKGLDKKQHKPENYVG